MTPIAKKNDELEEAVAKLYVLEKGIKDRKYRNNYISDLKYIFLEGKVDFEDWNLNLEGTRRLEISIY